MKKEYASPEFDIMRVLLADNLCVSAEDPMNDVHENDETDDP